MGSISYRRATRVITLVLLVLIDGICLFFFGCVSPGGWWRTSGAGPAAPPDSAMTSPARASTWISLMPRSAALHAGEWRMRRLTCARLRNRLRLEFRPIEVQCTHTKQDTPPLPHPSPPPVAGGPVLDMNVRSATNSVGTIDIIAQCAARVF